jgi:uncharacterized membrane protein YjdF
MSATRVSHLILGDWNPIMRDPIDVLRGTFLVGAIASAMHRDAESAVRFSLTFLLLVGVRLLQLPRPFDFGFVLGMIFQAWGNALGLFIDLPWYDRVVHFVLPFFTAPAAYILLARLNAVPELTEEIQQHRALGIVIMSFAFGMTVGSVYEIYEWFADNALGAHLQVGYDDTIADLADNALGALGGSLLLLVWTTRGWGTTRRVPEAMLNGWRPRHRIRGARDRLNQPRTRAEAARQTQPQGKD